MKRKLKRWTEGLMTMKKGIFAILTIILLLLIFPATVLAANEKEGNNVRNSATRITLNESINGNIANSSDVDWFVFTTSKDGHISIQMDHPVISSKEAYWKLHIYQSDGVTPIYGTDSFWEVKGNSNLLTAELGLPQGTYCIRIDPYVYYRYDTSKYTLKVNFKESSVWEKEDNNTAPKATKIAVNKEYNGSISGTDDVDWYVVNTSKDGYITLRFDHPVISSTDVYWKMYICQSDGVTALGSTDTHWDIRGNGNVSTVEIGLPKGKYYIRIEPFSFYRCNVSTYTLKVNFKASSIWEKEGNESVSQANKISVNKEYCGAISGWGDLDWYVVNISKDGFASFQFDHSVISSTDYYWKMRLYQSDGVTPILGKDGYWGINGNKNMKTAEIGLPKGTYYICIEPYSYSCTSSGTYKLKVNFTASSAWEKEINNNYSTATNIPLDQDVCGSIYGSHDSDWYSFTLDADAKPSISFSHPFNGSGDAYWKIYLYQSDGVTSVIGEGVYWKIAGNKNMKTSEMSLKKGTYYIRVEPYDDYVFNRYDTSIYTLHVGTKVKVENVFSDISAGEWYVDAVQFVYDNGIMNGVDKTTFGPKGVLTREQFITVLYNMEGAPKITYKQIFTDVKNRADIWYAKPVTWAANNKITSGIGNGLFGTGKEITREELATLLYNYAKQNGKYKLTVDKNAIASFQDAKKVSDWAMTGMKWAVTNGVMGGKTGKDGKNILDPKGKATRAECAQMIMNLKMKAVK